jgi:hypothetical protein
MLVLSKSLPLTAKTREDKNTVDNNATVTAADLNANPFMGNLLYLEHVVRKLGLIQSFVIYQIKFLV